jgi:hypothetical protein
MRLVAPGVGVAAHAIDLPSQTIAGLPEQGFDLRTKGLDIGARISRGDGREHEVKLGGLDVPFAALVPAGGDLAVLDGPEDCRLVQAGGCCSRCECVRHTHYTIAELNEEATLPGNCCRTV